MEKTIERKTVLPQEIAMIALDMDGTLLNSHHVTTAYTRAALERAAKAGKIVAIATGRCLSELAEHVALMPEVRYLICESGACIHDRAEGRDVRHAQIPRGEAMRILELARGYDLLAQMFIENQSYIRAEPGASIAAYHAEAFRCVFETGSLWRADLFEWFAAGRAEVSKFNLYFTCAEDRDRMRAELAGSGLALADTTGLALEISSAESTKGQALRRLCAALDVSPEHVMAVGDSENDVDMMDAVGLAVAMGNAVPRAREAADVVTGDCDHDGAARAIERFLGV